ncbi:uncharacterized protein N7496_002096 [Penicillium cataractarum]|uniref:Uncharacterized protein n=1 Tax=Penicillium cataractarum TaxID=2100454 RepID=A0A9W9SJI0_9EURO|nr:uncharacterized protein N7496_002096 [Penicillium cataractarum]KAJ5379668.1 hypothetical protein N7496_002096 [Penicillium cataractarum]
MRSIIDSTCPKKKRRALIHDRSVDARGQHSQQKASKASTTMQSVSEAPDLPTCLCAVLSQGKRLPGVSQDDDPSGGVTIRADDERHLQTPLGPL